MKTEASDTSKAVLTFVSGIALGIALVKTVKSKFARKAAVAALAKGMQFKDDAQAAYEVIKEDAQDVVAEAKVKHIASGAAAAEAKAKQNAADAGADVETEKAADLNARTQSAANEDAKPKRSPSKASAPAGGKATATASKSGSK